MHILGDRYLGMLSADGTQLQVFDINSGHMSCCGVGKFVHRTMKSKPIGRRQVAGTMAFAFAEAMDRCGKNELQTSKEKPSKNKNTGMCSAGGSLYLLSEDMAVPEQFRAVVQTMTRCFMHAIQTTCDNSERVIPGMNAVKEVKR